MKNPVRNLHWKSAERTRAELSSTSAYGKTSSLDKFSAEVTVLVKHCSEAELFSLWAELVSDLQQQRDD